MNEKSDFNQLLEAIRARPGMYLGEKSLFRFQLFFAGYRCALNQHQIADYASEPTNSNLQFLLYVARHTDGKSVGTRSYHMMISRHVGGDEAKAFDLFWQLLDDFRAEQVSKTIHD